MIHQDRESCALGSMKLMPREAARRDWPFSRFCVGKGDMDEGTDVSAARANAPGGGRGEGEGGVLHRPVVWADRVHAGGVRASRRGELHRRHDLRRLAGGQQAGARLLPGMRDQGDGAGRQNPVQRPSPQKGFDGRPRRRARRLLEAPGAVGLLSPRRARLVEVQQSGNGEPLPARQRPQAHAVRQPLPNLRVQPATGRVLV